MIQRMQTIWLLLASAAAFLTLKLSVFSGNKIDAGTNVKSFVSLTAMSHPVLLIPTVILGSIALVAIFLYKNRKLQMRLTLAALLLSLLNLLLYYTQTQKFVEGRPDLTAIVALIIPVLLLLAIRGIYKDQKLIKSLDRLR